MSHVRVCAQPSMGHGALLRPSLARASCCGSPALLLCRQAQRSLSGSSWASANFRGWSLLVSVSTPGPEASPALSRHNIMAFVLKSQEPGRQPSQEETDIPGKSKGKFLPAPGLPSLERPLLARPCRSQRTLWKNRQSRSGQTLLRWTPRVSRPPVTSSQPPPPAWGDRRGHRGWR